MAGKGGATQGSLRAMSRDELSARNCPAAAIVQQKGKEFRLAPRCKQAGLRNRRCIYETTRRKAEALVKERLAATEAGRPKSEPAPGSLEYQALHPDWKPQEESY
jgi:hypothetical protein